MPCDAQRLALKSNLAAPRPQLEIRAEHVPQHPFAKERPLEIPRQPVVAGDTVETLAELHGAVAVVVEPAKNVPECLVYQHVFFLVAVAPT
jgi:hypothetical protein